MSKTETTKQLERLLANHFDRRNDFFVFECTLGWYGHEIVDCVCYNTDRQISCYEIKQSKQDFHSKNKLSFFGNKNYFVMPLSLYEEVKDEIPPEIGCYAAIDRIDTVCHDEEYSDGFGGNYKRRSWEGVLIDGLKELHCVKRARRQELKADKEVILSSMLRSMQRDVCLQHFGGEASDCERWHKYTTETDNSECEN